MAVSSTWPMNLLAISLFLPEYNDIDDKPLFSQVSNGVFRINKQPFYRNSRNPHDKGFAATEEVTKRAVKKMVEAGRLAELAPDVFVLPGAQRAPRTEARRVGSVELHSEMPSSGVAQFILYCSLRPWNSPAGDMQQQQGSTSK